MPRLILEYDHLSQDDNIIISGGVYAMIFHPWDGSAIAFDSSPYQLDDFDGDQHGFSLPLVHQTPRSRHYSEVISSIDISLPDNEDGEQYSIEYWGKPNTVGDRDRAIDKLLKVDKLSWHDDTKNVSRLTLIQEQSIADKVADSFSSYHAMSAFSYDSETNRIGCMMWLERSGEMQTGCTQASFELVDSENNVVATAVSTAPNTRGEFQLEAFPEPENMNPDETYYAKLAITDSSGTVRESGAGVVLWD